MTNNTPTSQAAPTTEAVPTPVIEDTGPISIHEDEANGSFNLELSPTTTPAVRDVVVSWALVTRADFRSTANRIATERAEALAKATPPPALAPAPGATTLVPPTTAPPPPPPPPVTFNAYEIESSGADGTVRIQVDQQLGSPQPESWSIAFFADADGAAVLSAGIIANDARESFEAALREQLGADATEWTHKPGTLTTQDLTFDGDGNLLVRLPSILTASDGQTTVTLPRKVVKSLLSPVGKAIRNGKPAYRGKPDCGVDRCVALSYDDGPSGYTAELLDHLDHAKAPATFFMIGRSVEKMPDEARQVADRGYQIGNHTWTHPRLGDLDMASQTAEIEPTQRVIQDVTGESPDMLRPPYGSYDDSTRWQQLALMFWNVDTKDWSHRDPAKTVATALAEVKPGSVILMHDLHHAAVLATPYLIARLRGLGYTIAPLDTMFPAREPGGIYRGMDDTEPAPPPTTAPPPPPPPTVSPGTLVPETPAPDVPTANGNPGVDTPATPPPANANG